VYLRESSLGLVLLVPAAALVSHRFRKRAWIGAAIVVGMVVASLAPWASRNALVTGERCWLTTRGGISLFDGVGPQADGGSDLGDVKQMPAVRGLGEVEWNRYFLQESFAAIRHDPGRILRLAGVKLRRLWNIVPNVETHQSALVRGVSAVWTLPTFTLAAIGAILLVRRGRGRGLQIAVFLLMPALYISALHSVFVGSVRYRLIAMPMLEMLAAGALVTLWNRARKLDRKDGQNPDQ
jgi:hypothetical protein